MADRANTTGGGEGRAGSDEEGGTPAVPGAKADQSAEALALVDPNLDDEGKTDAELWNEIDAEEIAKAAGDEPEKPAAAAAAGEAGEAGDEEKPAADKAAKPADKWAAAPADLKAEFEALKKERDLLEQSERSNRERVSALQRKYEGPSQSADARLKNGKTKAFQSEKGQALEREFPEIAAPVAEEIQELRGEVASLREEARARETAEHVAEQTELLEGEHADWLELARHKDFGLLSDGAGNPVIAPGSWLQKQPRHIREAAVRNATGIVDAEEAADVIGRFKAFRSAGQQDSDHGPAGDGGKPPAEGKNGSALSGKRQRQLESASGTRAGGPGVADGIPAEGDAEEIWKAFDRKEAREQSRRSRA